MKNIYLVRHGQSMANVDKVVHADKPDHAIPLSALGEQQATAAGAALRDIIQGDENTRVRIWTSPYKRTRDTADRLQAELTSRFKNMDRREHIMLCEQQFGLFDGIPDEDLPKRFPLEHAHYALAEKYEGRFWARMPMGESRFDVAVRVHQAFGTFHRDADRHGIENVVVVCHGVTLRAFVMQWRHYPYEWFETQPNPGNCDIYHLGSVEEEDQGYVYRSSSGLVLPA
jgi:2,3-bisphosphoglycerate-dependent phosphoglycerate mutase